MYSVAHRTFRDSSSAYAPLETPPTTILPASVAETTIGKIKEKLETKPFEKYYISNLGEYLMSTCPPYSITIDSEQTMFDYSTEPSSTTLVTQLPEDYESFLNMILSSLPPLTTYPEILPKNSEASVEVDVTRSSSKLSQSTISKTIIVSRLPATVNSRRLRTLFPGCRKITFKKNHWNKNFRL